MDKAVSLADLYRRSVQMLTQNRTEWMGLLSSASKFYKLSFDKNVLIYLQRPDAGLLATKTAWEKQTGRSIKPGSKGIGVVDMDSPLATLAFYFDFADTRGDDASFRRAMGFVWELEKQYRPEIRRRFHERFGTDQESMENCLCQLAESHAAALFAGYPAGVDTKGISMLQGLPQAAVKEEFMRIATDSAAYIIFKKCGISTEIFEEGHTFENISHFGDLGMFMELGSYAMAAAKPVLTQIRRQIEEIKEERSVAYGQETFGETGVQKRAGRDAVPEPPDIGGQGDGRQTAPAVRQEMEGLHEGVPSPAPDPADGRGQDKRDDPRGGQRGGEEERRDDTEPSAGAAHAGDGGYIGACGAYGDDNPPGGGNHIAGSGLSVPVEPRNHKEDRKEEKAEPPAENNAGGSFYIIPESATGENVRELAQWDFVQGLLTDTEIYPPEMYARISGIFDSGASLRERRDAVRDVYGEYGFRKSGDGKRGIVPGRDVADFFFGEDGFVRLSWETVAHAVGMLIDEGVYVPAREQPEGAIQLSLFEMPRNYRFSPEHHLYDGGPKEKFRNNMAAVRLLKQLQEEARPATAEEQVVLARFVGWGGLADALTPEKAGWEKEYGELKALLTEEEMRAATASTLTSYYTSQDIITYIYRALGRFGFRSGNILDPAMGTGNFYSVLPQEMEDCRLYGVEIDPVAGGIAQKLYPNASIAVTGFEEAQFPDSFFDVVMGNVPFGKISMSDRRYAKHNFKIHDYFIAKSLDKLRSGGILAVITSRFTMDKENSAVRKYIAQRAELIGAIRLPENAFKEVAGTLVTSDILFLKKRRQEIVPDKDNCFWLTVEKDSAGIPYNSYFIRHPDMVLGIMEQGPGMYGNHEFAACRPLEGRELSELLRDAVDKLQAFYEEPDSEWEGDSETAEIEWIPAAPDVKNFSYTFSQGQLYYRENSRMYRQEPSRMKAERIRGMLEVRDALRGVIDCQMRGEADGPAGADSIEIHLRRLNEAYERFVDKYGFLNLPANVTAFAKDSDAPLIRSVESEVKDEQGRKIKGEYEKTAVFYKATVRPRSIPKQADSAEEALQISLNMKGRVDLNYMRQLYGGKEKEALLQELGGRIYQNPDGWWAAAPDSGWELAEIYLSGHVKDKLAQAILAAERYPELFQRNVEALKQVQPEPLKPEDISFVLGSTWIPEKYYQQFMYETFATAEYLWERGAVHLEFAECTGTYYVSGKNSEPYSVTVNSTYGTGRMNAYEIFEASLNLRSVEVRDKEEYKDPATGEKKERYVLNRKETLLAREKQAQIKSAFENWLFAAPERGAALTELYNDRFNNIRPCVFNGDNLMLPEINRAITLRKHQRDVVAKGIYGEGNLLIAHEVGAGKTISACVIAHERKRLGICNKPLITVPNHTLNQWAEEFMRLYPSANILVATKKDMEKKKRRRFISRAATGDYDCIIMPHSSFELIALSRERQLSAMETEIKEITERIRGMKTAVGQRWTLKQMELFKKNLQARYDRLYNEEKKDDTISFEEMGVDNLIVDEAHAYKNNYSYTKMQRVAGVGGQSSQRAMDMHMKCQYINEISGERGVVYLTGTPVSNSMSELYVMQKTLQPREMARRGLLMFDAWASTFGRVETALEIKPEGSGYQMKTRFARFHNLPELMNMFSMVADIKTADMLNLPTPALKTGAAQVIKTAITPEQKDLMEEIAERAEAIRYKKVDSSEDNFLKLTNEARLLAVDPRILDPRLPDDPDTKLNVCARKAAEIYHETAEIHSTQLIFCDKGTPKGNGQFDFYHAMRAELERNGVAPEEIAFIHDADTDARRAALLEQVREGKIRLLMGSTDKMGTGLNVQERLIALHHLDVPWRPADLIQRNGRIVRQGNENEEVSIYNYITEQTFDAYLWQILEQKQRYISQIMTGRSAARSCEDIDEVVLQYAEFKALAVSDPQIKRKMEVDNEVYRLQTLKAAWKTEHAALQQDITVHYPSRITKLSALSDRQESDAQTYRREKKDEFAITLNGRLFDKRLQAGEYLKMMLQTLGGEEGERLALGSYAGFTLAAMRGPGQETILYLEGQDRYSVAAGESSLGNVTRLENLAAGIETCAESTEKKLKEVRIQMEAAKAQAGKAFEEEEKLAELLKEQVQINLNLEFNGAGKASGAKSGGSVYRGLRRLAPELLTGKYYYMKFKAENFDDLVLEYIGNEEYSMAHYYTQNGDAMRDPEITFTVDQENRTVSPLSYQQDNMGIYYRTCDRSPEEIQDLMHFWKQWLANIREQGYDLYAAQGNEEDFCGGENTDEEAEAER